MRKVQNASPAIHETNTCAPLEKHWTHFGGHMSLGQTRLRSSLFPDCRQTLVFQQPGKASFVRRPRQDHPKATRHYFRGTPASSCARASSTRRRLRTPQLRSLVSSFPGPSPERHASNTYRPPRHLASRCEYPRLTATCRSASLSTRCPRTGRRLWCSADDSRSFLLPLLGILR